MCGKKFLSQWLWHSLVKLCTKNYENPSIFVKVTAKNLWHLFSGHGVLAQGRHAVVSDYESNWSRVRRFFHKVKQFKQTLYSLCLLDDFLILHGRRLYANDNCWRHRCKKRFIQVTFFVFLWFSFFPNVSAYYKQEIPLSQRPRDASCQSVFRWVTQDHSRSIETTPLSWV